MDRQADRVTAVATPSLSPGGEAIAPCLVDVVAIGASAGGIAALHGVLGALPTSFPAAIVIVLHLAPHHRSLLAPVLARNCALPVHEAKTGDIVRPGVVHVAPPNVHLTMQGGVLLLTGTTPEHHARPSVDVLFASVALACEKRAVGVILSGAGVDGARGIRAIKRAGGRIVVQDPGTAEYSGMPAAAAATGCADMTLPLMEIGPALVRLTGAPPVDAGRG
jgi:two-component system chemotaxis response regulator CheB